MHGLKHYVMPVGCTQCQREMGAIFHGSVEDGNEFGAKTKRLLCKECFEEFEEFMVENKVKYSRLPD
jgi:hypothetical protein